MKLAEFTVYARYALIMLATKLAAGGWLPPEIASQVAVDPALIEALASLMLYAATIGWYWVSKSYKALKDAVE